MLAIVDMDTLVYKAAGAAQKKDKETGELILEPVANALSNAKSLMHRILAETRSADFEGFLTESNSQECKRTKAYPLYKANRKGKPRPHYYNEVREYYIEHWGARVVSGIEADDAVAMLQWELYKGNFQDKENAPAILVGIDKDLNQIPGWHYDYVKQTKWFIDELEAHKSLYLQIMTGDVADNIPRIKKRWICTKFTTELEKQSSLEDIKNLLVNETKKIYDSEWDLKTIIHELNWRLELLYLQTKEIDGPNLFEASKYE